MRPHSQHQKQQGCAHGEHIHAKSSVTHATMTVFVSQLLPPPTDPPFPPPSPLLSPPPPSLPQGSAVHGDGGPGAQAAGGEVGGGAAGCRPCAHVLPRRGSLHYNCASVLCCAARVCVCVCCARVPVCMCPSLHVRTTTSKCTVCQLICTHSPAHMLSSPSTSLSCRAVPCAAPMLRQAGEGGGRRGPWTGWGRAHQLR